MATPMAFDCRWHGRPVFIPQPTPETTAVTSFPFDEFAGVAQAVPYHEFAAGFDFPATETGECVSPGPNLQVLQLDQFRLT